MTISLKPMILVVLMLCFITTSCSSDDDNTDTTKPTITINYDGGFPQACEALERGQTYTFKAQVADNVALASYSLDIHHNFDHHTHDDQIGDCEFHDDKTPINPFLVLENYSISGEQQSYEIALEISIPNDVDTGDYHCEYSVIDKTGWRSQTSIDITIIE
ncbi:MAG: DUF4625 domain-containing protein [Flavobacteriaceae bacterium]|nr:DUF4625 domain-containing protein [Flavobacteriaceae bacterium]